MANSITATVQTSDARVLLRVEYSTLASSPARVDRSADGGVTWTTVRGGEAVTLVGSGTSYVGYLYDTEMPLNTAVTYRSFSAVGIFNNLAGTVTVVVADGVSWMRDPARPWADLEISECVRNPVDVACLPAPAEPALFLPYGSLGAQTRASDANLYPVLNRRRPADVWAYRKDVTTSWQVVSVTAAAMNSVETFYALGGPIFLQLDPSYGWPDRYYQPGNVDEGRLSGDMTVPFRVWSAPLTVIDAPPGRAQGTAENNWCAVEDTYPTWADMTATGMTWAEVVAGAAVSEDGYGFGPYGDGPYGDGG